MRILVAPQSYKGNLTALEVARAIAEGLRRGWPDAAIELLPIADGGEGTVQALVDGTGGELRRTRVTGPLGEPVEATWGYLGDGTTAAIEMAAASGLPLVPPERRNPLLTTTYGTGELILAALDAGCRHFIVGLGGSATNDGGAGMAQALGVRLLGDTGRELPFGGAALMRLARIDASGLDRRVRESDFRVAFDVDNPLCGPRGASAVYGPQKGATPEMVEALDRALAHFAQVVEADLGKQVASLPGAGAAGGLGAGLVAFLDARLEPGFAIVARALGLEKRFSGVELVFTGEGQVDAQAAYGKAPVGLARMAKEHGLPVIAIVGGIGKGHEVAYQMGVDAVVAIAPGPISLEESSKNAATLIADAAERTVRLLEVGRRL